MYDILAIEVLDLNVFHPENSKSKDFNCKIDCLQKMKHGISHAAALGASLGGDVHGSLRRSVRPL